jgi:hypothetical protein
MISAILALAILGISALVIDREYLFSAPGGVVEVDQPVLIQTMDEIVVSANR